MYHQSSVRPSQYQYFPSSGVMLTIGCKLLCLMCEESDASVRVRSFLTGYNFFDIYPTESQTAKLHSSHYD